MGIILFSLEHFGGVVFHAMQSAIAALCVRWVPSCVQRRKVVRMVGKVWWGFWVAFAGTVMMAMPSAGQATAERERPPLLVGYFPQWGLYEQPQYTVKSLLAAQGPRMLTQVNYAQAFVTGGRCSIADPNADLNFAFGAEQSVDGVGDDSGQAFRGNLHQLAKLKRMYPKLKLVISLEGKAADFAQDAQPEQRTAFVSSCVDLFVKGNLAPGIVSKDLFDGIDLDWEFPHAEDAANYLALLAEFRRQLDALRPLLVLSIAVGHSPRMAGAPEGGDLKEISRLVDEVGLMTYDFTGPWSHNTGFIAPLSAAAVTESGASPPRYGTVQGSVEAYLAAGVPAGKLIVGVPFYGYGWKLVPEENNGLFQEGQPVRGDRPYSFISGVAAGSTVYRQEGSMTPWAFDGDAFWTFDDEVSIRRKAEYAVAQHLGGLMIWELGQDTAAGTLLRSAYEGLHGREAEGAGGAAKGSSSRSSR